MTNTPIPSEPLPYQTPPSGPDPAAALAFPAVGLLVSGILTLGCIALDFLSRLGGQINFHYGITLNNMDLGPVLNLISIPLLIIMMAGAIFMLQRKSHGIAISGAVLAMVPMTATCCCIFTLPLGIWAMVILSRPEVKARFH